MDIKYLLMPLTLYWNLGSQPARAVKCLIDMGNLDCSLITVDVMKNQSRTKQFLAMNPLGQIPFIIHDNLKLGESNAILVYLCQKYPQKLGKYYGSNLIQRAKVNQHISWYQNFFRPALFKIIFLKIYEGVKKQMPVLANQVKAADKQMMQSMKQLQKQLQLSGTPFVAGQNVTIADLQYFFEITNLIVYEKSFDEFKLITAWFNRMMQIKEVKAITQEWRKLVPGITKVLKSVPLVEKSKL